MASDCDTERQQMFEDPSEVLRPTGPHLQKGLKYFDLGVKLEILLFELQSVIYWLSLVEIFFYVLSLIMFFRLIEDMWSVWLFTPHFMRGVVGLMINRQLPRSDYMIKELELPAETISFDAVHKGFKQTTLNGLFKLYEDMQ